MSLINTWLFTKTVIDWEKFAKSTGETYRVVSVRDYIDKKKKLSDGYTITVQVLKDNFDYGIDKEGNFRESNLYQTFVVTVLTRKEKPKKGDLIVLKNFDEQNSFVIGFDLILRFNDYDIRKEK
ncbi:hypothetical protein [Peptostreptococcus faecalis]|uniref:hypothetical protein n=1 Tax=Peptostreptococcus faecalis TaxID=2045015 RepID=UPI000C7D5B19|nr:hypothetical protein [Peptostreptococcus faecalis]